MDRSDCLVLLTVAPEHFSVMSDAEPNDPLKPALPYVAGAHFNIKQHVPPEPHARIPGAEIVHKHIRNPLKQYGTPSRCCLARPPQSTEPHQSHTTFRLIIADQLVTRVGRGAQLVTCQIGTDKAIRVAKIYDPLYYDWTDGHDCVQRADDDYAREATAYEFLFEKGQNGVFTPLYLGAWTFETPLLDGSLRQVRMILIDHIPFPSMLSLLEDGKAKDLSASFRMKILARLMESYTWLAFYGVFHNDLEPRNILVDPDITRDQPRAVLVDLGVAKLKGIHWFPHRGADHKERPSSPGSGFARSWKSFHDWVPEEFRPARRRIAWIEQQWGNSDVFEPPDETELKWRKQAIEREDAQRANLRKQIE